MESAHPGNAAVSPLGKAKMHRVQHVRQVSPSAFVLRLDRRKLAFRPGQYINLGKSGHPDRREYTIYSTAEQSFLEVLIKEVEGGLISQALKNSASGELLPLDGPFGFFAIDRKDIETGKFYGRVTDYIRQHPVDPRSLCYLCGNSDMIYEALAILRRYGIPSSHLFAEVYF